VGIVVRNAREATMPGLRTRSAGAKVTEEEYAQIEKLAEARDLNVSE
jgi:hypothetical protein